MNVCKLFFLSINLNIALQKLLRCVEILMKFSAVLHETENLTGKFVIMIFHFPFSSSIYFTHRYLEREIFTCWPTASLDTIGQLFSPTGYAIHNLFLKETDKFEPDFENTFKETMNKFYKPRSSERSKTGEWEVSW